MIDSRLFFGEEILKLKQEVRGQLEMLEADLTHGRSHLHGLLSSQPGPRSRRAVRLIALLIVLGSLVIICANLPAGMLVQAVLWMAILSFATAITTRLVRD
jgi:hypothetical protein